MTKHSLEPQKIDDHTWFYDQVRGINVVHEFRDKDGALHRVDQFIIPWQKLKAALARHYA